MSPTQRSLKYLRDQGWVHVQVVERWNPYARIRQDLFGFIDILAMGPLGTLAVQTTSGSNVSARVQKITALPAAKAWVQVSNRWIEVHGWRKVGERGKRKTWEVRVVDVKHEDFV